MTYPNDNGKYDQLNDVYRQTYGPRKNMDEGQNSPAQGNARRYSHNDRDLRRDDNYGNRSRQEYRSDNDYGSYDNREFNNDPRRGDVGRDRGYDRDNYSREYDRGYDRNNYDRDYPEEHPTEVFHSYNTDPNIPPVDTHPDTPQQIFPDNTTYEDYSPDGNRNITSLDVAKDKLRAAEADNRELTTRLKEVEDDLDTNQEKLDSTSKKSTALAIATGILALISVLLLAFGSPFHRAAEDENEENQQKVTELQSEVDKLVKERDQANKDASDSGDSAEDLQKQVDDLNRRVQDAEGKVAERDGWVKDKDERIKQLEKDVADAEAQTTTETTTVTKSPRSNGNSSSSSDDEPRNLPSWFYENN